ncbi:hypothetical protein CH273_11520 [Rhodococcus sp. 05-339-2]|uniref:hypothetical protein n=1 Tax=Rhodococcoides fascians TaxID=1828 RepID=UPI00050CB154|nr:MULTISPECIES: hypothetical protein [Rhodococcus]OZD81358.1 hypothetical protein CH273_11520 [Rhodococcus sp. 05-339-2]
MHVATDIEHRMFDWRLNGASVGPHTLLPDWNEHDRLGVVIREPFGSLGASLLMQTCAFLHYEVCPERRSIEKAQYPQIFTFHVGGKYGDHSAFDVWPPRREVTVNDSPLDLLDAVNDRAITRLLIPETDPHATDYIGSGFSAWSDVAVARERIKSVWEYGTNGTIARSSVEISTSAEELTRMSQWALTPETTYDQYSKLTDRELVEALDIGPSSASDLRRWLAVVKARTDEVPSEVRSRLSDARVGDVVVQQYRPLSMDDLLARL